MAATYHLCEPCGFGDAARGTGFGRREHMDPSNYAWGRGLEARDYMTGDEIDKEMCEDRKTACEK